MTSLTAARLEELEKAASDAPWVIEPSDPAGTVGSPSGPLRINADYADMVLIVALRNDILAIIRAKRVLEVVERMHPDSLRKLADKLHDGSNNAWPILLRDLAAALEQEAK